MRVLITGGFGFLGGRLAKWLAANGDHQVLLGTRNAAPSPSWLPSATVVQTRWHSGPDLERACVAVDAVVHLAGMNARDCAASPDAALEVNGLSTARLVRAASRSGVPRFVYVSTAHVYGSPLSGTITETTCPTSLHPYATSHRAGEDAVRSANERGDTKGVVLRLSNAYGAPVHKDADCWMLLANDLCRQAVATGVLELRTSGLQRRDFVPVDDVCVAIDHVLHADAAELECDVLNLGGQWAPTVWDMAALIQRRCESVLGQCPELRRVAPAEHDPVAPMLNYRMDAILRAGLRQPSTDKGAEIDRLLTFCREAFPSR